MARELLVFNIIYLWPVQSAIKKQWSVFQNGRPMFPIRFPHNSVGIQSRGNGFQECIKAPSLHHWNTIPNTWVERWTGGAWREECQQGSHTLGSNPQMHSFANSSIPLLCTNSQWNARFPPRAPFFWHAVTRQHVTSEWPQEVTGRCQSPDHQCCLLYLWAYMQIKWNISGPVLSVTVMSMESVNMEAKLTCLS